MTKIFSRNMQLSEQAIERGLVGPAKRLIALAMVIYLSAAIHPILPSILSLIEGPRRVADGQTWSRGDFEMFRWRVFPLFEGLSSSMAIVFAPVMIFCITCSALDRCDAWRINVLAGVATFFLYVIDDPYYWGGSLSKNAWLLVIVAAAVFVLFGVPHCRSSRPPMGR